MKIHSAEFIRGATDKKSLPQDFPEIAVVGRSNVGKSSLLNYLLNRKKLVSFSRTPGKTRQINYFLINQAFYLVDIPGFGYAKLSKKEHGQLKSNIENYFNYSEMISGILYLFDSRVKNSPVDAHSIDWLEGFEIPMIYLATKTDKLKKSEIITAQKFLQTKYALPTYPLATSSVKKQGKTAVWEQIHGLLGHFQKPPK